MIPGSLHPSIVRQQTERRARWMATGPVLAAAEHRLAIALRDAERATEEAFDGERVVETEALLEAEARLAEVEVEVVRLRRAKSSLAVGAGLPNVA